MARKVLSVGQCGFDNGNISRMIRTHFQAEIVPVDSTDNALDRLGREKFDLVLVNRVFDAGGDGMEFIRQAKATPKGQITPVMLVSNYPECQEEAVAAGAVHGFGKNALGTSATLATLRPYLATPEDQAIAATGPAKS